MNINELARSINQLVQIIWRDNFLIKSEKYFNNYLQKGFYSSPVVKIIVLNNFSLRHTTASFQNICKKLLLNL